MPQPDDTPAIQNVIAAFPLPTLAIGASEKVEYLNAAAEILLGTSMVGRHFTTVLRHPKLVDAVERSLRDQVVRTVSYQVLENGRDAYYDVHLQMIAQTDLLLVSVQNATVLAQAEQMRRDFVANVSHELRTPLTAVMGFIETLRGPARDDVGARDRFLGIMAGEAERMNRLVGGLLSLSRVEAEQRVRPTQQQDLSKVLQTAVCTLEPLAADSNVTVHLDPAQDPLHVIGDADQLLQVFTNLLENAIKYGGADQSVEVEIAHSAHDPVLRGPAIEITVVDHGPGMESIHLPRLTERFYRADTHRSRDLGGTGLGLAIVKHILNRHRGRLKVTSTPGQGSRFTVVLPPAEAVP
ncbi:ATP-binding protein [Rhodobacteraceae bacterium KMM 6894]|nr:ATP-binding protein [Rhodobacteraceae bacterium KMM 6894]